MRPQNPDSAKTQKNSASGARIMGRLAPECRATTSVEPKLLQLVAELPEADPEQLRRGGPVSAGLFQRLQDQALLDVPEIRFQAPLRLRVHTGIRRRGGQLRRQL